MLLLADYYNSFFLASNNDVEIQRDQREVLRVLQASPEKTARYFYERTRKRIISKSFSLTDDGVKFVDIVRDVLRYVPLYWTATELVRNLKTVQSDMADEYLTWMNRLAWH
jgi:linoleate 10R-lipoxygenase